MPPVVIPPLPQRAHRRIPVSDTTALNAANDGKPLSGAASAPKPWDALNIDWSGTENTGAIGEMLGRFARSETGLAFFHSLNRLLADLKNDPQMLQETAKLETLFQRLGFAPNAQGVWRFDRNACQRNFSQPADGDILLPLATAVCHRIAERLLTPSDVSGQRPAVRSERDRFKLMVSDALEEIDACGPGVITRLQDFLLRTAKAPDQLTIPDTIAQVKTSLFDDAVNRFYVEKSRINPSPHWLGNQVHYLSAAREVLGPIFRLPKHSDTSLKDRYASTREVSMDVEEGLLECIENALTPSHVASHLAERYLDAIREVWPEASAVNDDFGKRLADIEWLQSQRLLPAFGPVGLHQVLVTDDAGTMQLQSDLSPLAVELARNAAREACLPTLDATCTFTYEHAGRIVDVMECKPLCWQQTAQRHDAADHAGPSRDTDQAVNRLSRAPEAECVDSAAIADWLTRLNNSQFRDYALSQLCNGDARTWQVNAVLHYLAGPYLPMEHEQTQTVEERIRQLDELHGTSTHLSEAAKRCLDTFGWCKPLSPALLRQLPNVLVDELVRQVSQRCISGDNLDRNTLLRLADLFVAQERFASLSNVIAIAGERHILTDADHADIAGQIQPAMFVRVLTKALERANTNLIRLLTTRTDAKDILDTLSAQHTAALSDALFDALCHPLGHSLRNEQDSPRSNVALPELLHFMRQTGLTPLTDARLESPALAQRILTLLALMPADVQAELLHTTQQSLIRQLNQTAQADEARSLRFRQMKIWNEALNTVTQTLLNHAQTGKPWATQTPNPAQAPDSEQALAAIIELLKAGISVPYNQTYQATPWMTALITQFKNSLFVDLSLRETQRTVAAEERSHLARLDAASLKRFFKHPVNTWKGHEHTLQNNRWLFTQLVSEQGLVHLRHLLETGALTGAERGAEIGSRHGKSLLEFATRYGCRSAVELIGSYRQAQGARPA